MRNTSFASKGAVKQRPSSIMARWRFAGIPGDKTYFWKNGADARMMAFAFMLKFSVLVTGSAAGARLYCR